MNGDAYRSFLSLLNRLDHARITYRLFHSRNDAVMIEVVVPGERWEIELVDYGDEFQWEVERFISGGSVEGEAAIDELFATHEEPLHDPVGKS